MGKYLKVWEGTVNSGRNMGYPKTKTMLVDDLEDIMHLHGDHENEKYFKLVPAKEEKISEALSNYKMNKVDEKIERLKKSIDERTEDIEQLEKKKTEIQGDWLDGDV